VSAPEERDVRGTTTVSSLDLKTAKKMGEGRREWESISLVVLYPSEKRGKGRFKARVGLAGKNLTRGHGGKKSGRDGGC